jgi:hypothetical protein
LFRRRNRVTQDPKVRQSAVPDIPVETPSAEVPTEGHSTMRIELPLADEAATAVSTVSVETHRSDTLREAFQPLALSESALPEQVTIELSPASETEEPSLLPALSTEAYMKERDSYFTPGLYAPSLAGSRPLLGPDLSFRVRSEKPRKPVQRLLAPAPTAVSPPSVARHLMDAFVTATAEFLPAQPPVVAAVDPLLLTAFFSDREGGPGVPAQATNSYLTEPALLALGQSLRDRVVANWRNGRAPVSAHEFYALARDLTGHTPTALLLCHHVAKAFSRGSRVIRWEIADRTVPAYFDGHTRIAAVTSHPSGMLRADALSPPSIFYLLFSARELAASDPGDWYRFFASAAIGGYTCQSRTVGTAAVPAGSPAEQVALRVMEAARAIRNDALENTPAYRGWVWANAVAFDEGATWGRSPTRNRDAARSALKGAIFGLVAAMQSIDVKWRWHVPAPGGGTAQVLDPTECA